MEQTVLWNIVLVAPGEGEVPLLAMLGSRKDVRAVATIDPIGEAVGTAIAEVMGIPVRRDWSVGGLGQVHFLVTPAGRKEDPAISSTAGALGATVVTAKEFMHMLRPSPPAVRATAPLAEDFEHLERETESVHRTLSRIEEALERESLLRWLLSLATRAVNATSGSIMLYDERSCDLTIAFAYGLSEATLHGTRVALGEGIAGRVAASRRAELVEGRSAGSERGDRPDITGAICAPLVWEERLLGVLNVNVVAGDPTLDQDDLATLDHLARRVSLILHRFLGIQRMQAGALFQKIDVQIQELLQQSDDLLTVLSAWAGTLALHLKAKRLALAVACADGGLLVARSLGGGETSVRYELADDPAWRDVLEFGKPLVVAQNPPEADSEERLMVFHLPVGKIPVQAILTIAVHTAAEAHHVHEISGEIIYLLEKRLVQLIQRENQRDRQDRLTTLANQLTRIATTQGGGTQLAELIATGAQRLTGARQIVLVGSIGDEGAVPIGPSSDDMGDWLPEAARLLTEAQGDGWRVTLLSSSAVPHEGEQCLLAVTAGQQEPAPGMLLVDKERLHKLDGTLFTAFDAELALHLARLLPLCLQPPASPSSGPSAAAELVMTESTPLDIVRAVPLTLEPPEAARQANREILINLLRREMDRCDRYHSAFALVAFRPRTPTPWDAQVAQFHLEDLAGRVRGSDSLTVLPDGTLLLLAPEDVQAIGRLERRLIGIMQQLTELEDLQVSIAHHIYPGKHSDPQLMLQDTLAALDT